jgi:predicted RNA polymerase sigma factor
MRGNPAEDIQEAVGAVYRSESRRILATLIRLLGDFELAEEAMHDAFAAALAQWPRDGIPTHPRAWLVSAGRFKAIDGMRRNARRLVTDGPFAETREQLGGYFLIDARDLDEAIAVAERIPGARKGTVELRPVHEIPGLPAKADER